MIACREYESAEQTRSVSDWIALAVLGSLLALNLVHIGLAALARDCVIVKMSFTFPDDGHVSDVGNSLQRAFRAAARHGGPSPQEAIAERIRAAGPHFRSPRPEVGMSGRTLSFIFLARDAAAASRLYELTARDLNVLVLERFNPQSQGGVSPSGVVVSKNPWMKPLDYLATLTLLGSLLAWLFAK